MPPRAGVQEYEAIVRESIFIVVLICLSRNYLVILLAGIQWYSLQIPDVCA
jgi:hypothetical protein